LRCEASLSRRTRVCDNSACEWCVADSAVGSYLEYCRASARAIIEQHWSATKAVAAALDEHKTLDGEAVDMIIANAESVIAQEAEQQRRKAWRTKVTAATAAEFEVMSGGPIC
jgi:hypothetical protein